MAVPDCKDIVADLAARYPTEWRNAHQKDERGNWTPEAWDFNKIVAWVLHTTVSPNFGMNGKRGSLDPYQLSCDAVNYRGEGPGHDPHSGASVTVIDFIGGAGGDNPEPVWNVINEPGPGAWVQPKPAGASVPAPSPIGSPWTAQHDDIVARLGTPNAAGDVGFVRRVAQQFRYTFGPAWGMKRAAPGRDLSNNVLGYLGSAGLIGFKVVPVRVKPEPLTLGSPQVFEVVDPVDHLGLGSAPPVVTPPPPVDPPVVEPAPGPDPGLAKVLEVIVAGLADVSTRLAGVEAAVEKQRAEVLAAVRGQSYEFSINLPNFMGGQRTGTISPKAPAKE